MRHARQQEQAQHGIAFRRGHGDTHAVEIVQRHQRADMGIGPAVIEDQLAAIGREGRQIGIVGIVELAGLRFLLRHRFGEGEGLHRPWRDGIGREEQMVDRLHGDHAAHCAPCRRCGHEDADPVQLAPRHGRADFQRFAVFIACALIDQARGFDLGGGQALAGLIGPLAQDRGGIDMAGARIGDLAIHQPVEPVTGFQRGGMQRRQIGGQQDRLTLGIGVGAGQPCVMEGILRGEGQRRGARGNAVEVTRVTLRFDQRLASAVAASGEVAVARRLTIEHMDQRLGGHGGSVDPALGEILALLQVVAPAHVIALMAHVGAGHDDGAVGDGAQPWACPHRCADRRKARRSRFADSAGSSRSWADGPRNGLPDQWCR
jgi:hypothetical protein